GDGGGGAGLLRRLGSLPALFIATVDQLPELPIEAAQRRCAAHQCCGASNMAIEGNCALETGAAEPQAVGACRIGSEPFGVDVEHEEDRAVLHIRRDKIVWFPRVDGNNRVFHEEPSLISHINAGWRSTDMKNQMPFAMRMHVEGAV